MLIVIIPMAFSKPGITFFQIWSNIFGHSEMCLVSMRSFLSVAKLTREKKIILSFFPCGNYVRCHSRLVTQTRSHERQRCRNGAVLHSCCFLTNGAGRTWRREGASRAAEAESLELCTHTAGTCAPSSATHSRKTNRWHRFLCEALRRIGSFIGETSIVSDGQGCVLGSDVAVLKLRTRASIPTVHSRAK